MSNIFTVTNNLDSGSGSLRAAISAAAAGDTIVFDPSLASQTITLTSGQININKTLIIDGAAAPGIAISGNNTSRVFELPEGSRSAPYNVTLRNLTVANGKASGTGEDGAGAGIKTNMGNNLTVENCQFNNNAATYGGGAIFTGFTSNLTVINSSFDGNEGFLGKEERGGGAIASEDFTGIATAFVG
ncbi:hypothetical protein [Kamptonema sp. UHCC 0994]|uniref:hypothetical protein n=1 Tax=Kamptonema sp. UHCC 0994 TaxID=3031329 RepID=UPI0023BA10EA|nr:hypothetical protein [Kamptonema sp. UHCC 0994]MDF0555321.1 hypothetical protein [Kamptonema sp. UHCC 0994]